MFNVSRFLSSSNLSSILKSGDWCSPSLRQYACASVSHLSKRSLLPTPQIFFSSYFKIFTVRSPFPSLSTLDGIALKSLPSCKRQQAWPPLSLETVCRNKSKRIAYSDPGLVHLSPFFDVMCLCMSQGTKLTSRQLSSILTCYITDPTALLDQGAFLLLFQQVNSEVLQTALNEISVQVILASEWRTISSSLFRPHTGAL